MWRIRRGSAAAWRGRCSQEYGPHRHRRTTRFEQPNQPPAEPGLFIDDGNHGCCGSVEAGSRHRPPTLPREDTMSRTPPRFGQRSAVDGSNPPGWSQRRPGVSLATPAFLWPRQRRLGHASVALATPAAFGARFVGYFWRSRGQRVRGVAKEADRDPPAEAGGAAVTSVTKPPTPAGGSRPVSETTIRNSRHADPRSPIG